MRIDGLDWKRALGLQLWFAIAQDVPVAIAVEEYEALLRVSPDATAPPVPWYRIRATPESDKLDRWQVAESSGHNDALFELIKLAMDSKRPLEDVLCPRAFTSSPLDYPLSWHLSILLSRVLRCRNFSDREAGEGKEGKSPKADAICVSYAFQLEAIGLWWYAAFVLLHLSIPEW